MMRGPNILMVEDDELIRRFVRRSLEEEGFRVCEADTQRRGAIEAATCKPDLVIVDLGLRDGDGFNLIREVRAWSNVPVLVLSARSDESNKVEALDAGADDYLTKPFGSAEFSARVRAMLRRITRTPEGSVPVCTFGNVRVDLVARTVARDGEFLRLTPVEFRLLAQLITHAGKVLTHNHLLREVWGPTHEQKIQYLRVYMGRLRQKLEQEPTRPRHFRTEGCVGYRFVPDELA
jgi:two-component system KDP operon response regulator KdpE